ncbi:hypothetical protein BGW37DRAFT_466745 [Umbelopsis sp. PMI_123]|nr:hypothetical protein BGW37DRAFT_466745 [Umbelopsis sp. PMI_123]
MMKIYLFIIYLCLLINAVSAWEEDDDDYFIKTKTRTVTDICTVTYTNTVIEPTTSTTTITAADISTATFTNTVIEPTTSTTKITAADISTTQILVFYGQRTDVSNSYTRDQCQRKSPMIAVPGDWSM